MTAVLGLLWRS